MSAALALLASLLWGASDFMGGLKSRSLPPVVVYLGSQIFGFVFLAALVTLGHLWIAPAPFWGWGIATSVVGIASMITFYQALSSAPMGLISPIAALAVVVPVGVGLLQGESPRSIQVIGILVAVTGVLLASGPELGGTQSSRPLVLAGMSAVGFGLMYVLMAEGSKTSAAMTMFSFRASSMVLLLMALAIFRNVGGATAKDLPIMAGIGIVDATANLSYGVASTLGLMSVTSVLGSLYPVVTAVLAAVVLRERLRAVQYVGVSVAMVGVLLISAGFA